MSNKKHANRQPAPVIEQPAPAAPVPSPVPAPAPTPAPADDISVAEMEPATTEDIIGALLDSLEIDPRALAGLEIRPQGTIRVQTIDRTHRSIKFTGLPRYERDANGRIVE